MICVDNSEWMRNGDVRPTRLLAQQETVNYVARTKIERNAESVVGVLSMAGKRIQTHVNLTRSVGDIMNALKRDVLCEGVSNFLGGVSTAQLALKNRQNKNQRQRIVIFVGSPVDEEEKTLVKKGKILKKNNIAVDVINFGTENDENDNVAKLTAFVNAVSSGDNSHFVHVPPGPQLLSDMIISSPIVSGGGVAPSGAAGAEDPEMAAALAASAAAAGGGGGGGGGVGAGVDPNEDPELAMALRLSMEEARQQQQGAGDSTAAVASTGDASGAAPMEADDDEDDEDLLAQAIALSMAQGGDDAGNAAGDDETMEQPEEIADALQDPDFIASLLDSAGVDQDELGNILGGDDEEEEEADKDKDKKDKDKDKDKKKDQKK